MSGWAWWAAAGGLVLILVLCRRPLAALCGLAVRSALGMVFSQFIHKNVVYYRTEGW